MFLLDCLPLFDILHETIFPMLDYESRIQCNRCLPATDRYVARFRHLDILSHECFVVRQIVSGRVDRFLNVFGVSTKDRIAKQSKRMVTLMQTFEERGRAFHMLHYSPELHASVCNKLASFLEPNSVELAPASPYFRTKLSNLARALLPPLQAIVPTPKRLCMQPIALATSYPVFLRQTHVEHHVR
jgi:hypothetical protein